MSQIPKSHPRLRSLMIRERLVEGYNNGLVADEGLMAHGRGETFDYLIGEKTSRSAKLAIKMAAKLLHYARYPVISVNGNVAALCPKEIVKLARTVNAKIEVNLFYSNNKRKQNIVNILKKNGANEVLGADRKNLVRIHGLDSSRRSVDKYGIFQADIVLVPLEDGDRTIALKKLGKKVITFDLNPLSRTAQNADVTIVDNIARGIKELLYESSKKKKTWKDLKFDNKKNLSKAIMEIQKNLRRKLIHV